MYPSIITNSATRWTLPPSDYYPNTSPEKSDTNGYSGALTLDLTRGIKRGNFWIMETISGPPGCWFPMWRTPQPGFIRAFAWQCISRRCRCARAFPVEKRLRSAPSNSGMAMIGPQQRSRPQVRGVRQAVRGSEPRSLPLLAGSEVHGEAAILHSHDQYNSAFRFSHKRREWIISTNLKQCITAH